MNDQNRHEERAEADTLIAIKKDMNLHEIEVGVARLILAHRQIEPSF